MENLTQKELLEAGVHFGHLKKKWNPKMAPYIFMERKGIHLIDLNKTREKMEEAAGALRSIAKSGKKILFVATKKQAKDIVENAAKRVNMPFVTERWLGGMLTNFATIRRSIKKMQTIDKMFSDGTAENLTKKERLTMERERAKIEKVLGGVENLGRMPAALVIVDINHEHIAIQETKKLNITTFGIVDTNSDPNQVDFPIPANDDATKSVTLIVNYLVTAIEEGLKDRQQAKEEIEAEKESREEEQTKRAEDKDTEEESEAKTRSGKRLTRKRKTVERKTKAVKTTKEATEQREKDVKPRKETVKTETKEELKAKKETSDKKES